MCSAGQYFFAHRDLSSRILPKSGGFDSYTYPDPARPGANIHLEES